MELDKETTVCICQHIKAYFRQCADKEKADFGEPCADCPYALKTCRFDWLSHLKPLFKETGIRLRLVRTGRSEKQGREVKEMEIRSLEVDFDKGILKVNGKELKEFPVIVTLPGPEENFPYQKTFNSEFATGQREECDRLMVTYKTGRR